MTDYMSDEIYKELKTSYTNNLERFCDKESLQYACFKQWIKCCFLTKHSVRTLCIPPAIKYILQNYSERLVCDYCYRITWNFDHRVNHVSEQHLEEIYAIISGLGTR